MYSHGRAVVRTVVSLPADLSDQLNQRSVLTGAPKTELIRRALAGYLNSEENSENQPVAA